MLLGDAPKGTTRHWPTGWTQTCKWVTPSESLHNPSIMGPPFLIILWMRCNVVSAVVLILKILMRQLNYYLPCVCLQKYSECLLITIHQGSSYHVIFITALINLLFTPYILLNHVFISHRLPCLHKLVPSPSKVQPVGFAPHRRVRNLRRLNLSTAATRTCLRIKLRYFLAKQTYCFQMSLALYICCLKSTMQLVGLAGSK